MEAVQFINENMEGFRVSNGCVDIPDVDSVRIAGLSLSEAQDLLRERYRAHINDVEVFISYKERLTHKVEITGMAERSSIPVDGKIRLYEVLSKAKIDSGANLFMSYVSRRGEKLPIDFHRLINKGDMSYNIVMRAGDKIFIAYPEDATVMVMGEVIRQSNVKVPYGFISLREAIVSAGGIPFTGDKSRIQIIRGNIPQPKVYVLSWEHIVLLPNHSLLLMPGDTVYISEKPITQWNRFIEQLLPSITTGIVGSDLYNRTVGN
jgi:polysaccharide export outer membrane protein